MCGIAGVYATGADANPTAALRGVTAMTAALSHRGPDGHGSVLCTPAGFTRGVVAFGHARLAVIDLSERASQPMAGCG